MLNWDDACLKYRNGETVDFCGILVLFGALMGAGIVPDASPGCLGHGGRSATGERGSDGEIWATMI